MSEYNINIYDEEYTIELNEQGPQGATGPKGEQGPIGPKGEKGDTGEPGPSNVLSIGTVEKGEEAEVTIEGESPNQVLNFILPKGDKGERGEQGIQGIQGEQGVQGIQGPRGFQGEVGPRGEKGERGYTGPIGPKGVGVVSTELVSTVGLVKTYRMNYSDGTSYTYQIRDGASGATEWGAISGSIENQTDLKEQLDNIYDVIGDEVEAIDAMLELKADKTQIEDLNNHLDAVEEEVDINTQRIEDILAARFPNAVIIGTPRIEGGQVSNYSDSNYLQFPFVDISRGLPFDIYFSFTTSNDVTTQQNILDSYFGIALAIMNGKGIMSLSSNGTGWDIGTSTGTNTLLPNTTYYVKYSWTGSAYSAALSTNESVYVPDMNLTSSLSPNKTTIFIGGSPNLFGPNTAHPFKGTINFNKAKVVVNGITVWEGMDNVGLASRANVSLNNLDSLGEKRFTDLMLDVQLLEGAVL